MKSEYSSNFGSVNYPDLLQPRGASFDSVRGDRAIIEKWVAGFSGRNKVSASVYVFDPHLTFTQDMFRFLDTSVVVAVGGGGAFMSVFQPLNGSIFTCTVDPAEPLFFNGLANVKTYWWYNPFKQQNMTWNDIENKLLEVVNRTAVSMLQRCPTMEHTNIPMDKLKKNVWYG